jgi:hypothetical protein
MSPPLGSSVFQTRATWQAPSLANIKSVLPSTVKCIPELTSRDQQMFINMQIKSQVGRDKIVEHIIHEVGLVRYTCILDKKELTK